MACTKNEWNRRVELADGEVIIIHSPNSIAHHQRSSSPDSWGNPPVPFNFYNLFLSFYETVMSIKNSNNRSSRKMLLPFQKNTLKMNVSLIVLT